MCEASAASVFIIGAKAGICWYVCLLKEPFLSMHELGNQIAICSYQPDWQSIIIHQKTELSF